MASQRGQILLNSSKRDFIVDLFDRGYNHVLEKIVMNFTYQAIIDCKEVSPEWSQIVLHFYKSNIPRILKLQDCRINDEWRNKSYSLRTGYLQDQFLMANDFQFQSTSMIADQKNIFMAAYVSKMAVMPRYVIVAYYVKYCHIVAVLFSQRRDPSHKPEIHLTMNESHLFGYVKDLNEGAAKCLTWKKSDFSLISTKSVASSYIIRGLASTSVANTPYVHAGLLHLPAFRYNTSNKLCLEVWDVFNETKVSSRKILFAANYYFLKNATENFFTRDENILLFYSDMNTLQWKRTNQGRMATLIGLDKDYAAFTWESIDTEGQMNDIVEIIQLKTGAVVITFEARYGIQESACAKFAFGKFAISLPLLENNPTGKIYDTIVFDLKLGRKIFSLKEDLGFYNVRHFEMDRYSLFFVQRRNIHIATFWLNTYIKKRIPKKHKTVCQKLKAS